MYFYNMAKNINPTTTYRNMVLILKVFSLVLFLSTLTTTRSAANAPLYHLCSNDTSNNSFQTNLHLLLKSLPSQASLAGGFYNTSTNTNGDDSVYVLALCRGDITPDACQDCLNKTSQEIVRQCPNGKEASIFQEVCQIRYSDKNFFSELVYAGKYTTSTNTNSSWNTNQTILDNGDYFVKLTDLMKKISKEAAFDSPKMFATGEDSLTSTHKMYGLGQCSRDISRDDCSTCLTGEAGDIFGCCSNKEGGFVVDNSCNLRYELYQFYESSPRKGSKRRTMVIIISSVLVLVLVTLMGSCFYQYHKKKSNRGGPSPIELPLRNTVMHDENQMDNQDLQFMDLSTIKAATDDFSDSNKLGQGGFGTVYEGRLMDGNYVAVKRLSRKSWQGLVEFRNEVVLIAKLQHRNLVKLLGYGIEGEEKLLIYEYMPNKSLDLFIFDETRRFELDWKTCFNIIVGIARGLLYLHEDSRLTIIHRDLKPNNVLLDNEMNAKISDFGMARIFDQNQSHANTVRVVGTHGYMAPEYAMEGIFSVKSDVYSFGVVLLEILSGKRSTGFYLLSEHGQTFLSYVWCLWNEGRKMEFIHTFLIESATEEELLRCLRIGLLCVQEDADDRPTMSSVLVYLGSNESTNLPQPRRPAFLVRGFASVLGQSTSSASENLLTISNVSGR